MSVWSWILAAGPPPATKPRGRPRKRPDAIIGYVGRPPTKPKKKSGGQAKYDLADIERRITDRMAERGLPSRRAALCDLLFNACHTAKSPALQTKAGAMDETRARIEKHEKLSPARLIVRVVQDVEGDKLKAVEELLRKYRTRTR